MSKTKRLLEEIQERGYSSNEGKTVCSNCFDECGIQQFIKTNHSKNHCSYCKKKGKKVIACDLDSLVGHILKSIKYEWGDPSNEGLPRDSSEGGWQLRTVYNTWELLSNIGLGNALDEISEDIGNAFHNHEWCERNPFSLRPNETLLVGWQKFSKFVLHTSRYVFLNAKNSDYNKDQDDEMNPVEILDALGSIIDKLGLVENVSKSTEIKRVRIVAPSDELRTAKDLGSPPREDAKIANRMSPAGISMFYGAFDLETAISETYEKGVEEKKAVSGTFRPTRELTVIDLSKELSVPSLFDEHKRESRSEILFLMDFISDFTKPIERSDREHIDYVPTQIVTEYFRHIFKLNDKTNIDGVIYPSSKNQGKKSIVIFADSKQCVEAAATYDSDSVLSLINVENHQLPRIE